MIYYVYLHRRKDTGEVFYVGKGCGKRAWKKTTRSEWWKRIEEKCGRTVEILAKDLAEEDAFKLEQETIERFGRHTLCNLTAGGCGGVSPSEETRRRMSEARKGWNPSPKTRERMRAASTGRRHSEETKAKLRAINLGNTGSRHTEVSKKAISIANTGRVRTPEQRAKVSKSKMGQGVGRITSEATRARISAAHLGRKHTPEARMRMSIASTGIRHSPETIAKMTEKNRATNIKLRKPVQCSNGMVFGYTGDAVKWLKENGRPTASGPNIASCCAGKLKTAYGYAWSFAK